MTFFDTNDIAAKAWTGIMHECNYYITNGETTPYKGYVKCKLHCTLENHKVCTSCDTGSSNIDSDRLQLYVLFQLNHIFWV